MVTGTRALGVGVLHNVHRGRNMCLLRRGLVPPAWFKGGVARAVCCVLQVLTASASVLTDRCQHLACLDLYLAGRGRRKF